jgi:hypothetical protein
MPDMSQFSASLMIPMPVFCANLAFLQPGMGVGPLSENLQDRRSGNSIPRFVIAVIWRRHSLLAGFHYASLSRDAQD